MMEDVNATFPLCKFGLGIDAVLEVVRISRVTYHSSHVKDVDQIVEHDIAAPESYVNKGFRKGDR